MEKGDTLAVDFEQDEFFQRMTQEAEKLEEEVQDETLEKVLESKHDLSEIQKDVDDCFPEKIEVTGMIKESP